MRDTSLVFPVTEDGKILLGRKKRGMGFGKWNGFGGKIEIGESMEQCAVRELYEECGLIAEEKDLRHVAELYFDKPSDPSWSHGGSVYFLYQWEGDIKASEEMQPQWYTLESLPYEEMWKADCEWIPLILAGKKIKGTIVFGKDDDMILSTDFHEIKGFIK